MKGTTPCTRGKLGRRGGGLLGHLEIVWFLYDKTQIYIYIYIYIDINKNKNKKTKNMKVLYSLFIPKLIDYNLLCFDPI